LTNTEVPWQNNEIVTAGTGSLLCPPYDVSILLFRRNTKESLSLLIDGQYMK
jgi:hypothetical protein